MAALMKELWMYARENKKYWVIPIVMLLVLFGALIFFAQGSVVAPFVYTLF